MRRCGAHRLLLLALLAFGVLGMHTLGHPTHTGHGGAHLPTATTAHHDVMMIAVEGTDSSTGMLDPMNVCLAILTVLTLAALVSALYLATGRQGGHRLYQGATLILAGRGPPARPPLGLILADLSVLRR